MCVYVHAWSFMSACLFLSYIYLSVFSIPLCVLRLLGMQYKRSTMENIDLFIFHLSAFLFIPLLGFQTLIQV